MTCRWASIAFCAWLNAQRQDHLALPQRNGVDQGGLDLFRHQRIVVLDHPDLRRHLQADDPGQLQIVQLLLKALALIGKVVGPLRVLRQAGLLRRGLQGGQGLVLLLGKALPPGQDIHRQLLVVFEVLFIHLVQQGRVLHAAVI